MGFCRKEDVLEFFHTCPEFERMLIRSGLILINTGFRRRRGAGATVSRAHSGSDQRGNSAHGSGVTSALGGFSKAKDDMFAHTDVKKSRWYVVNADDKKRARLNCIHHLLNTISTKT